MLSGLLLWSAARPFLLLCNLEQVGCDLDFASDEAFVILLKFSRKIAVIHGDAIGITQAVGPQVSKSVDSLEARAIGKMKRGDGS